jgi:hypothetical protein
MAPKKNTSMWLDPKVAKRLRILGATHSLAVGDVVAAALALLEAQPLARQAAILANFDPESGEIVPENVSETEYLNALKRPTEDD